MHLPWQQAHILMLVQMVQMVQLVLLVLLRCLILPLEQQLI
jgi:hypothetical protein